MFFLNCFIDCLWTVYGWINQFWWIQSTQFDANHSILFYLAKDHLPNFLWIQYLTLLLRKATPLLFFTQIRAPGHELSISFSDSHFTITIIIITITITFTIAISISIIITISITITVVVTVVYKSQNYVKSIKCLVFLNYLCQTTFSPLHSKLSFKDMPIYAKTMSKTTPADNVKATLKLCQQVFQ